MIVFLASDVMLFAPFFAAYFLLRATNDPWPAEGVEIDWVRALAATLVLMASSVTLVASEHRLDHHDPAVVRSGQRWLWATIALGAVFLANQLAEYVTLSFRADDHPYGSIYWGLTGLHGLHVTAGIFALGLLAVRVARSRAPDEVLPWRHGVGLFWHLVDAVWIGVFLTIWVIR